MPPIPPGIGSRPAELADQVAHQDDRDRGREAERVEGRPEHRVLPRPETRDDEHQGDRGDRHQRREQRQAGRLVDPEEAEEHHQADHGDRDEVDGALDQEEGDRPPRDAIAVHPAPVENPGAEGEPAGAAGGDERSHRQLRASDLPAPVPTQPMAEDRREHDDVGAEGERLEGDREGDPAGGGALEQRAHLAEPGGEQDDEAEHRDRDERRQPSSEQGARLELAAAGFNRYRVGSRQFNTTTPIHPRR